MRPKRDAWVAATTLALLFLLSSFAGCSSAVKPTQGSSGHSVNADRFDEWGVTCFWIDRQAGRYDGGNAVAIDCIKDGDKS